MTLLALLLNATEIALIVITLLGVIYDYSRSTFSSRSPVSDLKFGVRRAISFDIPLDIVCTGLLMFLFAGTFGGMMAAMVGGLAVSITLLVMKRTMTREQLMFVKTKKFPYRSFRWVEIDP